ncbi:hypothetical protein BVX98_02780 [bacterium F11]|nr:hypothetical protein BVX98_02780 [bacterium F11]
MIKCLACQTENKDGAKICKKCSVDLSIEPLWRPTWRWHLKVLGTIYVLLIIAYFVISHFLSTFPEPYRTRDVPEEVTPWLNK